MGNLISTNLTTDLTYFHIDFSSSIDFSFANPDTNISGVTWDGTDTYLNEVGGTAHQMVGKTSSVNDTFAAGGGSRACTHDGTDFYDCDRTNDKLVRRDGFSSTKGLEINAPSDDPHGITLDGTDFYVAERNTNKKYYKLDEFSTTQLDEWTHGSSNKRGITWDGTNLITADFSASVVTRYVEFTSSVKDTVTNPGSNTNARGVSWDGFNQRMGINARSYAIII